MASGRRGRPQKPKRNTAGLLQNHKKRPRDPSIAPEDAPEAAVNQEDAEEEELEGWIHPEEEGAPKLLPEDLQDWDADEDESDSEWNELEDEALLEKMVLYAAGIEEDFKDEDWMPAADLRAKKRREMEKKERPKTYVKGPDIGSKSARTRRRHKALLHDQSNLNRFWSAVEPSNTPPAEHIPVPAVADQSHENPAVPVVPVPAVPAPMIVSPVVDAPASVPSQDDPEVVQSAESVREPVANAEAASHEDATQHGGLSSGGRLAAERPGGSSDSHEPEGGTMADEGDEGQHEEEAWEEELAERLRGKLDIRSWEDLRTDLKKELSKNAKRYNTVQLNQLTILRNFATLRLKGYKRIPASLEIARQWHESSQSEGYFARRVRALARHYQVFEQLPIERRGGRDNARSHLHNEAVQTAAREWLTAQPSGSVSPCAFRKGLNEVILPAQNIMLSKPLCERTARRWLVKLGWRKTLVRKGVYMDHQEHRFSAPIGRCRRPISLQVIAGRWTLLRSIAGRRNTIAQYCHGFY